MRKIEIVLMWLALGPCLRAAPLEPCMPVVQSSFRVSTGNYGPIAIDDTRLVFLADHPDDLDPQSGPLTMFYDISDPMNPVLEAASSMAFNEDFFVLDGSLCWFVYGGAGAFATVVDISDPLSIPDYRDEPWDPDAWKYVGFDTTEPLLDFSVKDGYAILATTRHLLVYDVSGVMEDLPVNLVASFEYFENIYLAKPQILDDRVVVLRGGTSTSKLTVFDISNPAAPVQLGVSELEGEVVEPLQLRKNVLTAWGYSFPGSPIGGVGLYDISDPNRPGFLGTLPYASYLPMFSGDYAYYRDSRSPCSSSLRIADVSSPQHAHAIGTGGVIGESFGATFPIARSNDLAVLPGEHNGEGKFVLVSFACEPDPLPYDVVITDSSIIGPEDTSVFGEPLAQARVLVSRAGIIFPGGLIGCALPNPVSLVIEGEHQIESLTLEAGSHLTVQDGLSTGLLSIQSSSATLNGQLEAGNLLLQSSSTTLSGQLESGDIVIGSLQLLSGSRIAAQPGGADPRLFVAGDLFVDSTSSITATGLVAPGMGATPGHDGDASGGGAGHAGHGGKGGDNPFDGIGGAGGGISGNEQLEPPTRGSGGGGTFPNPDAGGSGGGLLEINVAGTAYIEGTVKADGTRFGESTSVVLGGIAGGVGGGSGGGIIFRAGAIDGDGLISARGGAGDDGLTVTFGTAGGGGGGGGRIAWATCDGFLAGPVTFDVTGGAGGDGWGGESEDGEAGSVYQRIDYANVLKEPADATVEAQGAAQFIYVAPAGPGSVHQWFHDGVQLVDGPTGTGSTIFGAQSPALRVSGISVADEGLYHCVATGPCGTLTSQLASLAIASASCPGDTNGDLTVDLADLNIVLFNFGNTVPAGTSGDVDGNGMVDLADLNLVLFNFGQACS